jgi:single-stranded-DNA-specific exonuclease
MKTRLKRWLDPPEVVVPQELQTLVGGHPMVAETLVRRGFAEVEAARGFLDPDHYRPASPFDLPNLARATERLERAIRERETICVWGDFDVDGQTATTILVSTLRDLGAVVRYHIPHRERESHGVNLPALKRIIADGADLVLTCDTGVTAHEPIAYAQAQGVDVIVTDHHDLPPSLPDAHAVVNPKMLPDAHPLLHLPGVGVAYKLAEALYERAGRPEDVAQFLDLVALGIVADVAVESKDTRYLLQRGLQALRRAERLGLRVLMEVAEINRNWLTEEHIGFELGPRLNALGRLADATVAIEFLTTDNLERARILATQMDGLNARRKLLCDQVAQAAQAQIAQDPSLLQYGALVLSHSAWPPGVVGIVAGRMAKRYHKPTVLIATPPGELGRGSARSIPGCDIHASIAAQEQLLTRFGGHPMAAGLSIDPERISEFRHALSRTVLATCPEADEEEELQIDGYVRLSDLSLDLVEDVERMAPFGPGNPPLTLACTGLTLQSSKTIGRTGEHRRLVVEDEAGTVHDVVWWRGEGLPLPEGRFDLAFLARASDFRGQRNVQMEWIDARPIAQPAVELRPAQVRAKIEVVDYRQEPNPGILLANLREREIEDAQVWAEAEARAEVAGRDRHGLARSKTLVIWTTPPGPAELRAVLAQVSPHTVYLFGIDPGLDEPRAFLARLAGLVKWALRSEHRKVRISSLAGATAQREATVRAGLAWLAARGHVTILDGTDETDETVGLAPGSQTVAADLSEKGTRLQMLLEETAAYRAFFARADGHTLIAGDVRPALDGA